MLSAICVRRWAGPGCALLLAWACGCVTAPSAQSEIVWRARAERVAAQRLAADRPMHPIGAAESGRVARSATSSAETNEAFVLSAWTQDRAPRTGPALVQLVADSPESAEPTTMPSRREMTQFVERGPLAGFVDTVKRDVRRAPGELWADTQRVYTDPGNPVSYTHLTLPTNREV